MPAPSLRCSVLIPLASLLLPALGQAQTAPGRADQAVQLTPFEVSASEARGYATTSSTSASRVAVPITDLASSVIVINEKLIDDVLAVDASDTLNMIGGVSANAETQSQKMNKFSMRGYTNSTAQRDGFSDLLFGVSGGFNYTFIDRMEILKGPKGILYGNNNLGGILNLVSKKPLANPRTKIDLTVGSHNFYQANLDTSNVLGADNQWGYRLSASYMNTDGPLDHPADGRKGFFAVNPVISFKTRNGFDIWVWTGFVADQSPRLNRIAHGFKGPNGGGVVLAAMADEGSAHNVLTNLAKVDTENYEAGVTKSLTFGKVTLDNRFLVRAIDQLNSSTLVNATGGLDVYVDRAGNIIGTDGRTINYSSVVGNIGGVYRAVGVQLTGTDNYYHTQTYAADSAISFDTGPIKHKLLVFGEYDSLKFEAFPGYAGKTYTVSSVANLGKLGADVAGTVARVWLYPLAKENLAGITPAAVIANANTTGTAVSTQQFSKEYSGGVVERASFLDQRVFLIGGVRYTSFPTTNSTATTAPSSTTDNSWQGSFGALVKLVKGHWGESSLFFNSNQTFVPVFTVDKRLSSYGQKLPDNTVAMKEVGFKADFLDSRLVATASLWKTHESNVLIPQTDVTGAITGVTNGSYSIPGGTEELQGWDMDLSANLARGLDAIFSAGETTTHLNASGGIRTSGQPTNTIAALLRYEFQSGFLKNFSAGWQFNYWGVSMLNNRTYWLLPPGSNHVALFGYHWKRVNVRLRVDDVFNHVAALPSLNETAIGLTDHRNNRASVSYSW
jgi:outer membrane receptor protein involved in Fe transport